MNHKVLTAVLFPAAMAAASCSAAETGDSAPSSTPAAAADVMAGEPVEVDGFPFAVASYGEFAQPWAIAIEPTTGNLFITEKGGTAKFFQPANGRVGTIESGLPEVLDAGQGGLGDIAFAPDYASSGTIYISWAKGTQGASRAALGRGTLVCEEHDSCRIDGFSEIWQQSMDARTTGHYSHRIEFSPDGQYLFLSSGERQMGDPAQDLSNNLGAVLRLNLDGTAATGNPFEDMGSPSDQIWSYGHRNLLGLQFDADGQLWDLEHGPRGGDEINKVVRGDNYGWPLVSAGINYNGDPIPDNDTRPDLHGPAITWVPVIAPGDFIFYGGDLFPDWKGDAVIANLGTTLVIVDTDASGEGSATEEARYKFPNRLRDIVEYGDGSIWMIEDGPRGRLLRLTPG